MKIPGTDKEAVQYSEEKGKFGDKDRPWFESSLYHLLAYVCSGKIFVIESDQ